MHKEVYQTQYRPQNVSDLLDN